MYREIHRKKCKVCQTGLTAYFDCLFFFRGLSYREIIERNPEYNLNKPNLCIHYRAGGDRAQSLWEKVKENCKDGDIVDEKTYRRILKVYNMLTSSQKYARNSGRSEPS
jgi:hypothetical protein